LAAVFARTLPCYSRAPAVQQSDCPIAPKPLLEAVLIEGHTDDVPISTSAYEDNWELGSARAINTYKALHDFEPSLGALHNHRGEDLLGVSSYEAHRPVSSDRSAEGLRLNRRIDLRFLIAAPPEQELNQIRRQVLEDVSP
jgi:flagellar motor protein MotB